MLGWLPFLHSRGLRRYSFSINKRAEARHSCTCVSAAMSMSALATSEVRKSRSAGCGRFPVVGAAGGNTGWAEQPRRIAQSIAMLQTQHLDRTLGSVVSNVLPVDDSWSETIRPVSGYGARRVH